MSDDYSAATVLFVDDEEKIINSIRRGLLREPYRKIFTTKPREAVELLKKNEISVLVTDMRMPELQGTELLQIAREVSPDTIRIILTGYAQISTIISAINSGSVYRYLTKPWKKDSEFIPTLKQAIEFYHLNLDNKIMVEKLKQKNMELTKQNFQIQMLADKNRYLDEKRNEIISYFTNEISPYLKSISELIDELSTSEPDVAMATMKKELLDMKDKALLLKKQLDKTTSLTK